MLGSLGSSVVLHWMVSFNFWFWFGFWHISVPNHSRDSFIFSDWTLCAMMGSLGSSVVIHWFGHILWCRWFLSISGFDSVSGAHFSPESFQRFIYFIQIGHFVLRRRVCWDHWEVVLYFTDLDISLWCRWFVQYWFWFGFWSSSQEYHDADGFFQSLGSSVVLHWFGHISMMQMVSFNFGL